jgi:hypothetical protein
MDKELMKTKTDRLADRNLDQSQTLCDLSSHVPSLTF